MVLTEFIANNKLFLAVIAVIIAITLMCYFLTSLFLWAIPVGYPIAHVNLRNISRRKLAYTLALLYCTGFLLAPVLTPLALVIYTWTIYRSKNNPYIVRQVNVDCVSPANSISNQL